MESASTLARHKSNLLKGTFSQAAGICWKPCFFKITAIDVLDEGTADKESGVTDDDTAWGVAAPVVLGGCGGGMLSAVMPVMTSATIVKALRVYRPLSLHDSPD